MVLPPKIEKYPSKEELMSRVYDAYAKRSESEAVKQGYERKNFDFESENPKSIGAEYHRNYNLWLNDFNSLWKELSQDLNPRQKDKLVNDLVKLIRETNFYYNPNLNELSKAKKAFENNVKEKIDKLQEMKKQKENGKEKALIKELV